MTCDPTCPHLVTALAFGLVAETRGLSAVTGPEGPGTLVTDFISHLIPPSPQLASRALRVNQSD